MLLAVADEPALAGLYVDAKARGLRAIRFHEPDLGDALTAIALEPAARNLSPASRSPSTPDKLSM